MRCKDCSEVRSYPFKRSHLVALRTPKITADSPPSRRTAAAKSYGVFSILDRCFSAFD